MSRLLLDTTFLVDTERSGVPLDEAIDDDDDVTMAAITVAELRVGVLLATDQQRADRLSFLEDVLRVIPVLDYDQDIAHAHAELLVHTRLSGKPRGAHDLMIAATAKTDHRTVLTADPAAFADLPGVQVQTYR